MYKMHLLSLDIQALIFCVILLFNYFIKLFSVKHVWLKYPIISDMEAKWNIP